MNGMDQSADRFTTAIPRLMAVFPLTVGFRPAAAEGGHWNPIRIRRITLTPVGN
jgi:hypothetical protein